MEINEADVALTFGFGEGLKVEGVGYSISIPDGFRFQQNMDVTDSMTTTTRDFMAWSPKELEPDQWSKADVAILSAIQVSAETVLLNPVEWFDKIKESLSLLGKATGSEVYSKSFSNDNVCGGYAVQQISDDCVNYHCVVGKNQNVHQFRIIINKPYSQQSMDNAVESWLRTMKCNSDSGIKVDAACEKKLNKNESEDKKEQLRSKLEEHRINREKEEKHVKEIVFSIITVDKKKTVTELQKENRELRGMSVQKIVGYLRRFVTSGALECMDDIYYMLPETAERIRTKEKKRQEEQQRQEEEKKKQEIEARREYERVKDSLRQAKDQKKQTESDIEKIQAEISEIETELEKQNKKLLFKDKSLIAKLNTDLSERMAKLKEVQEIKEQNIKAVRTLEEELRSKSAPFVQHEERTVTVNTATESSGHHYSIFHKREKVSHDNYMLMYSMRCAKALCDRKNEYLAAFEGRDDFFELKNAYNELPRLYNQCVSSILSTQLKMTSPISPYAAAALGTFIGGAAVGVVAAADAKEKQKNVADNNKRAMEIEGKQIRSRTSLNDCYECVERYILQNKATAEDWKRQLNFIAQEMNYEYQIRR